MFSSATHFIATRAPALFLCLLAACLPDDRAKIEYNDTPQQLADGWQVASPASVGFDAPRLQAAYTTAFREDTFPTAISLLVIRHGKLVAEGYFRDLRDRQQLVALQSATKSVVSMLVGMMIDRKIVASVETTLAQLAPQAFAAHPDKAGITVRDALTMRTGIAFANEAFSKELLIDGKADSVDYILSKPLHDPPGTVFDYGDCNPHLLAGIVQQASGMSLDAFATTNLFAPLGITSHLWETYPDGVTYGAVGLYLTARDFAKIGLLALQQGQFGGQQLISRAWMTQSQLTATDTDLTAQHGMRYGYYWWTDDDNEIVFADGHGGQFLYLNARLDLLIVFTAEPHTSSDKGAILYHQFRPLAQQIEAAIAE